jgi:hypothetical protein
MAGITQVIKAGWLTGQQNFRRWFSSTDMDMLNNTGGKKIYDCTDTELKKMLAYCCLMVGIDKPPGEDKKMVLVSFLRKYHGPLTSRQVIQAFELVASGELGSDIQEHYNIISPMYISNVIRAYLQKLSGIKSRYEVKRRHTQLQQSSPEAYYKRLVKVVEEYNVIPALWAWDEVHEYLLQQDVPIQAGASSEEKKQQVIDYIKATYPKAMFQVLNK